MSKKKEKKTGLPRLSVLTVEGFEMPDPRPIERKSSFRMPSITPDRVRDLVRYELSMRAQAEGFETHHEADDFELEDELWESPYEEAFEGQFDHHGKPRPNGPPPQPDRVLPGSESPSSSGSK